MLLMLSHMLEWFLLGEKELEFPVTHGTMCSLSASALVRLILKLKLAFWSIPKEPFQWQVMHSVRSFLEIWK